MTIAISSCEHLRGMPNIDRSVVQEEQEVIVSREVYEVRGRDPADGHEKPRDLEFA